MTEILLYHSISDNEQDLYATPLSVFETDMQWLAKREYKGLSLSRFYKKPEQEKAIVLTFDDGYRDFMENAVPVLNKHDFSATVFVVGKLIADVSRWRKARLRTALLDWKEIRTIIDMGHEIGSHGLYHRDLTRLPKEELKEEVFDSKRKIEEGASIIVESFSYPFCKNNRKVQNTVRKAGYKQAVGCGREYTYDFRANCFHLWRRAMKGNKTVKDFMEQ